MATNKAYWKNPEKYRELQRKWYKNKLKTNLDFRRKEQLRVSKWKKTTAKGRYCTIKKNSKAKKRLLNITQQEFIDWYEKQPEFCFYCQQPRKRENLEIDRLDNNKPYQLGNMKLACHDCNSVKGEILSKEEMQLIGKLVMEKRWKEEI